MHEQDFFIVCIYADVHVEIVTIAVCLVVVREEPYASIGHMHARTHTQRNMRARAHTHTHTHTNTVGAQFISVHMFILQSRWCHA
jgi:hypothetical protein